MDPVAIATSVIKLIGKIEEAVKQVEVNKELCEQFSSRLVQFDVILNDAQLRNHEKFGVLVNNLKMFVENAHEFISTFLPKPLKKKKPGVLNAVGKNLKRVGKFVSSIMSSKEDAQRFLDMDVQLNRIRDDFCAISTIVHNARQDPASSIKELIAIFEKSLRNDLVRETNKIRDEVSCNETLPEDIQALVDCPDIVADTINQLMVDNDLPQQTPAPVDNNLKSFITQQVGEIVSLSQMQRPMRAEPLPFPSDDEDISPLFDIHEQLGEAGAFGITNKVRYQRDNRVYAMKRIDVNRARQQGFDEYLLEREAESLRRLHHSNIVRFYHSFFNGDGLQYYVVMELVQGVTLEKYLTRRPSSEQMWKWMRQLTSALVYMHGDCHIIHRDLKPANIMITDGFADVKIIDFGLARFMNLERMTKGVGTPLYMSYEKVAGLHYDGRDDVWAMGCIFLELTLQQELKRVSLATDDTKRQLMIQSVLHADPSLGKVVASILMHKLQATRPTAAEVLVSLQGVSLGASEAVSSSPQLPPAPPSVSLSAVASVSTAEESAANAMGTVVSLTSLTSDQAISLLISLGCCKDLNERILTNAEVDVSTITGEYLQELDDIEALHILEGNTESKKVLRKPILKRVLAKLQSYQQQQLPVHLLESLSGLLITTPPPVDSINAPTAIPSIEFPSPSNSTTKDSASENNTPLNLSDKSVQELFLLLEVSQTDEKLMLSALGELKVRLYELDLSKSVSCEAQNIIRETNGIQTIIRLLEMKPFRLDACMILKLLGRNPINKDTIRMENGILALITLLSDTSVRVRQQAAAALWNVSSNTANQEYIRVHGGIQPLIGLLSDSNATMRQIAAGVLSVLSDHQLNKVTVRTAGGIPSLVSLLVDGDVKTRQNACGALLHLASDTESKEAIREAGGIVSLVGLLLSKDTHQVAAGALEYLATNTLNKDAIREADGIPPLVRLLSDTVPKTRAFAAGVLQNLANNKVNKDAIRMAEGIVPLVQLLSDEDRHVRKHAAGALRNLANNEANQAVISEANGVLLLENLLSDAHADVRSNAAGALEKLSKK